MESEKRCAQQDSIVSGIGRLSGFLLAQDVCSELERDVQNFDRGLNSASRMV